MLELKAEKREIFGKKLKVARRAGRLPVVAYGPKEAPAAFFVDEKSFRQLLEKAGESSIISLETGKEHKEVLIHEVAYHPVTGIPVHADLYVVEKGKTLKLHIPLEFTGLAPAVKELGGTLVKVLHDVEIEALPKDLPQHLTVDTSSLVALDSQILVKDIKVPAGVKVLHRPEEVVALIGTAKEEVEEAAPVDLAAIEVEKKGKKEEEGAAATTDAAAAKTAKPKDDKKSNK